MYAVTPLDFSIDGFQMIFLQKNFLEFQTFDFFKAFLNDWFENLHFITDGYRRTHGTHD